MNGQRDRVVVDVRKVVRSGMTYLPYLADHKARLQYAVQRVLHRPFEVEFLALEGLLSSGDLAAMSERTMARASTR
jgi:hypothetical protein